MAEGEGNAPPCNDSASVQYLQSGPDTPHTCWFLVGHADGQAPELVAGCRLHMMTYSVPLRNMLYDSEIAEKGTKEDPVEIPDVKPDTFRNFVKFINFNNIPRLSLKEAVDLVYVAEKYIVEDLKSKLEEHIPPLLNVENVFVPLKQPECFQNGALKNAIDKIVQNQTKELFTKEGFLELSSTELIHIVTQDTLSVCELELWREILRWAKHKTGSEEGEKLRECMLELLKHIRFCAMDVKDFCTKVVSTGILTPDEIAFITTVFGGKFDCEKSGTVNSFELTNRIVLNGFKIDLFSKGFNESLGNFNSSSMYITTDTKSVQILCGEIRSPINPFKFPPKTLKFSFKYQLFLVRITDYSNNSSTEKPVISDEVDNTAEYDSECILTFPDTLKLQPFNKYKLGFSFSKPLNCFYNGSQNEISLDNEGLMISWLYSGDDYPKTHFKWLQYNTM